MRIITNGKDVILNIGILVDELKRNLSLLWEIRFMDLD
nr:MAG TPA: hypothetical protein [Caudoviricetes sp.]